MQMPKTTFINKRYNEQILKQAYIFIIFIRMKVQFHHHMIVVADNFILYKVKMS